MADWIDEYLEENPDSGWTREMVISMLKEAEEKKAQEMKPVYEKVQNYIDKVGLMKYGINESHFMNIAEIAYNEGYRKAKYGD